MITLGTWRDIWLNEGFARYTECLWVEHASGEAAYRQFVSGLTTWNNSVYLADTSSVQTVFAAEVYNKGAWVLHMLRHTVGDSAFFKILKTYGASAHKYGNAVTADFEKIAEDVSGMDLSLFFQQWVYTPGFPKYYFSYVSDSLATGDSIFVVLNQVQLGYSPFKTSVELQFNFKDGDSSLVTVADTLVSQGFAFYFDKRFASALVDPNAWLMKFAGHVQDTIQSGFVGQHYADSLSISGYSGPFQWSMSHGRLPRGLTLSAGGEVSGSPEESGKFAIVFKATDANNQSTSFEVPLKLNVASQHGNLDGDTAITVKDLLLGIRYLYFDQPISRGAFLLDCDCDGTIGLTDAVILLNYLYLDGPAPCTGIP
jgi:hypothetical protein